MTEPLTRWEFEHHYLAPYAMHSQDSRGREHAETEHAYRGVYQRDRDRILHSAAFRRLNGKTQVFTGNMGDYHRTRLTHTMEVASIARTIGRTLRLNEDLIESLALLHDIGHPPFGHAGEDTLQECLAEEGGFSHNQFALTLVRELERPYPHYAGLNLSREVLDSQLSRVNKKVGSYRALLEAQVVDVADSIAYDAHDIDDAVKLGLLQIEDLRTIPWIEECYQRVVQRFGPECLAHADRPAATPPAGAIPGYPLGSPKMVRRTLVHELIDIQVSDVVETSCANLAQAQFQDAAQALAAPPCIHVSPALAAKKSELEQFLFQQVYRSPLLVQGRRRAQRHLARLFAYFLEHADQLPAKFRGRADQVGLRRAIADYLAGMTDRFCLEQSLYLTMAEHDLPATPDPA